MACGSIVGCVGLHAWQELKGWRSHRCNQSQRLILKKSLEQDHAPGSPPWLGPSRAPLVGMPGDSSACAPMPVPERGCTRRHSTRSHSDRPWQRCRACKRGICRAAGCAARGFPELAHGVAIGRAHAHGAATGFSSRRQYQVEGGSGQSEKQVASRWCGCEEFA